MSKDLKIIMLVGKDESSNILYNALKDMCNIDKVIMEEAVSKKRMLINRVKRLGFIKVFGQVLFILCNKLFSKFSRRRISEIKHINQLNDNAISPEKLIHVDSINDKDVIEVLQKSNSDAVVINGTRIISQSVLNSIDKPFINTHAGITPKYRGVHGGYWALANNDATHCGVTVHLVDPGIDTGGILFQKTIQVSKKDNFNTYPLLQLAHAIPLMKEALQSVENNTLEIIDVDLPSRLYYHPTLWEYFFNYLRKGVK